MQRIPLQGVSAAAGLLLLVPLLPAQTIGSFSDETTPAGVFVEHRPNFTTNLAAGGAVADFNRDGFQDIYFATGGMEPDALFINNGDGTFTDRAAEWGIQINHKGTGAAAGDFDGDGWIDLYVTSHGPASIEQRGHHKLWRNMQGTGFVDVAQQMGVHLTGTVPDGWGASFGDYDNDGDLDLAVPGYRPPNANHLFRNDGTHFTDVTVSAGLSPSLDGSYGFAVKFVDMDGDLDQDLLWVSDFGTGKYFVNNGDGTFTDFTTQSGTMIEDTEMGVTINDWNEDGLLDFWVTTVSENGFYINQGNNQFTEIAAQAGVLDSGWGWGAVSIDWNHDTKVDMIGTSFEGEHYSFLNISPDTNNLLFEEVREDIGLVAFVSGRGLSNLDYDNDGDQDVAIFSWFREFKLFRNDLDVTAPDAHWLRVSLDRGCATTVAPAGEGSIVRARIGTRTFTRMIDGASNYLSNSELSAHFGLGTHTTIDELTVQWMDGEVSTMFNVPADQHLEVLHPAATVACFTPTTAGCAGASGNTPLLTPRFDAIPSLGNSLFLDGMDLPSSATSATLLLSLEPRTPATPLYALGMPGCRLAIGPECLVVLPTSPVGGTAAWNVAIPSNPIMTDVAFYTQVFVADPQANALGLVTSNSLRGIIK